FDKIDFTPLQRPCKEHYTPSTSNPSSPIRKTYINPPFDSINIPSPPSPPSNCVNSGNQTHEMKTLFPPANEKLLQEIKKGLSRRSSNKNHRGKVKMKA